MLTQLILDEFHPIAKPIAVLAKSLDFGPKEWEGHVYKGIGMGYSPAKFYEILSSNLGRTVSPKLEYFRLGTSGDESTTYIHADNACSEHAAVWYLTDAPEGRVAGTAFWRHNETGRERLSEEDRKNPELIAKLQTDGLDESKWTLVGLCGQKFNRCVVYPSNLFHSRYPKDAWGADSKNGRVVFTSFFD